jgi:hypothetical protein
MAPGIADIELAMRDGYSTGNSLGMGLPGARRLMDDFDLVSTPGKGPLSTSGSSSITRIRNGDTTFAVPDPTASAKGRSSL